MDKSLQPLLYKAVCNLCKSRKEERKVPYIALERDLKKCVWDHVPKVLDDMVADGILECHENVNGMKMYSPVNAEREEI